VGGMSHVGGDDAFLTVVRYVPMLFVFAGVGVVLWLSRQRLPYELRPDVLAALSDTEALPPMLIRDRAPLAQQDVDLKLLVCSKTCARMVRWCAGTRTWATAVRRCTGASGSTPLRRRP
jgi:hypothetical protein